MRKVKIRLEQSPEGDWWVQSDEVIGFHACGDSREEALANAKDALSIFLEIDEDTFELEIIETKMQSGEKSDSD